MKQQPKKRNPENVKGVKKEKLFKIAVIIVAILLALVIYKILDILIIKTEHYNLSGQTYYQYFNGIEQEYSGKMEVVQKDNENQLILEDGQVVYLDSTPMYYKDILGKSLLPKEMELVVPDNGTYKLNKFTNVIEENNKMNLKKLNSSKTKEVDNGFLFDGNDLYFFLDDTTVTVGNKDYELPALSYAIVNYRTNVEIYNYDTNEYTIIQDEESLKGDVTATNKSKNYIINMSLDSLKTDKSNQLLITNINNLKEYDY